MTHDPSSGHFTPEQEAEAERSAAQIRKAMEKSIESGSGTLRKTFPTHNRGKETPTEGLTDPIRLNRADYSGEAADQDGLTLEQRETLDWFNSLPEPTPEEVGAFRPILEDAIDTVLGPEARIGTPEEAQLIRRVIAAHYEDDKTIVGQTARLRAMPKAMEVGGQIYYRQGIVVVNSDGHRQIQGKPHFHLEPVPGHTDETAVYTDFQLQYR